MSLGDIGGVRMSDYGFYNGSHGYRQSYSLRANPVVIYLTKVYFTRPRNDNS